MRQLSRFVRVVCARQHRWTTAAIEYVPLCLVATSARDTVKRREPWTAAAQARADRALTMRRAIHMVEDEGLRAWVQILNPQATVHLHAKSGNEFECQSC